MTKGGYSQPLSMAALIDELAKMTDMSRIVAGGTDMMVEIYKENPRVDRFISLAKVPELSAFREEKDHFYLGSMLTHDEIAHHPLINRYFTALAQASASIGSQQIRNRGTIGGNLVNASLAGDALLCLFLYHAVIDIVDGSGEEKRLAVDDFVLGARKTALRTGEIVRGIILPRPEDPFYSVFHKIGTRSKVTVAKISMALSLRKEPNRPADHYQAYLGAIPPKPVEVEKADQLLSGKAVAEAEKEAFYREAAAVIRRQCPDRDYKRRAVRALCYDVLDQAYRLFNT